MFRIRLRSPKAVEDKDTDSEEECSNDENDTVSELEAIRSQNIAELRTKFLEEFGEELPAFSEPSSSPPRKRRRSSYVQKNKDDFLMPSRRSLRLNGKPKILYSLLDEDDPDSKSFKKKANQEEEWRVKYLFLCYSRYGPRWPHTPPANDLSSDEDDHFFHEDDEFHGFKDRRFIGFEPVKYYPVDEERVRDLLRMKKRRKHTYNPSATPKIRAHKITKLPEDITERDLENIHYSSSRKILDPVRGTCCHQCRQKSIDTKSICRYSGCSGVRGQFCGFCLKTRYGEDVADVLLNPEWKCPVCRGICNCSICRTRQGKRPTGILAPQVQERGYKSVFHFLKDKENEIEKFFEDSFIEDNLKNEDHDKKSNDSNEDHSEKMEPGSPVDSQEKQEDCVKLKSKLDQPLYFLNDCA